MRSLRDLSRGLRLPRSLLQLLRWAGGRGHCPPASCPGTLPGSTICITAHALGGAQGVCEPQLRDGAAHGPAPVTAGCGRRCATRRPARGRSLQTGALPSLPPPLSGAIHCDTNQFSGAALIQELHSSARSRTRETPADLLRPWHSSPLKSWTRAGPARTFLLVCKDCRQREWERQPWPQSWSPPSGRGMSWPAFPPVDFEPQFECVAAADPLASRLAHLGRADHPAATPPPVPCSAASRSKSTSSWCRSPPARPATPTGAPPVPFHSAAAAPLPRRPPPPQEGRASATSAFAAAGLF
jgi:hypothetical protein